MAISLQKGQRQALGAKSFSVGLGWDANDMSGQDFDLDASLFILGSNRKLLSEQHFVFYNNLTSSDGAVEHTGDNLTGAGDGDDETININLSKLDSRAQELIVVVTIHDAIQRRQNFGQVRNSYVRIYDQSNREILKYELDEDYSVETSVEFGRIYKRNGEWKFEAVGAGSNGGLDQFVNKYN